MDALKAAFAEIRAVLDTEGVHDLLLDCYLLACERGERDGLAQATVLRRAVEEYARYERALAGCSDGRAGAVLGAAPFPPHTNWWALLEDGLIVPAEDRRAGRAVYWSPGPDGWFRVPGAEAREAA